MNSKGGGGNGSFAAAGSSTKAKSTDHHHGDSSGGFDSGNNNPKMDQLNDDSAQDGEWEVVTGKKARNRSGNYGGAKLRGASIASPKAWGHQQKMPHEPGYVGTGNNGRAQRQVGGGTVTQSPQPSNGNWEARAGSPNPPQSNSRTSEDDPAKNGVVVDERTPAWEDIDDDSDDYELIVDSDEELLNDDYDDFEMSQKSHDTLKKSRWFNKFFKGLEHLTADQMNEPSNQWHCPACQGGSGAIDWYRSMQALMTHARTRLTKRVLLHRKFAELLEEELRRKGISVAKPVSESFGRWNGLREMTADREIVWPPMVVVMNTLLERDENGKWIGMGDQELLGYFSSYDAAKARHSHGPRGHTGMSVLIFMGSAFGYLDAERLHKHFADEGTDREAWERRRVLFLPGGRRQLYGYMACKKDMDCFNQHSQGKSKLKFEMRSYQEMVVGPMKQMNEENQQLVWYKNKVAIHHQHEKALEKTMRVMSKQLRITCEKNRIVRERTAIQQEENKEQMDYMDDFFNNQVAAIQETMEAKARAFEKLLQEEREKRANNTSSEIEGVFEFRREEIARFIDSQTKGIEEFEAEREKILQAHGDKKTELKRNYLADDIELEKEFVEALSKLMEKYTPHQSEPAASS